MADGIELTRILRDRRWLVRLLVAVAFFLMASAMSLIASDVIARNFTDRPQPDDLALRALPYIPEVGKLVDVLAALGPLVVLIHFARKRANDIPWAIGAFGVTVLLRSAIVVLTPLASPHEGMRSAGVFHGSQGLVPGQNGMFPSGHAANLFLCFLLIDKKQDPTLRWIAFAISVAEWCALLLSRMHYSIDIVGGLLLAYFVFSEWTQGTLFDGIKRMVA